jgi:hypothetical protein
LKIGIVFELRFCVPARVLADGLVAGVYRFNISFVSASGYHDDIIATRQANAAYGEYGIKVRA